MEGAQEIMALVTAQYDMLYSHLTAYLLGLGRAQLIDQVEDCMQEAFLKLCAGWDTLQDHPNLNGWLYITALYALNNRARRERTRRRHWAGSLDAEEGLDRSAAALLARRAREAAADVQSTQEMLMRIRTLLSPEAYAFLIDYYDKAQSIGEVARRHSTTEAGARMRASRLVRKLRGHMSGKDMLLLVLALRALERLGGEGRL